MAQNRSEFGIADAVESGQEICKEIKKRNLLVI